MPRGAMMVDLASLVEVARLKRQQDRFGIGKGRGHDASEREAGRMDLASSCSANRTAGPFGVLVVNGVFESQEIEEQQPTHDDDGFILV